MIRRVVMRDLTLSNGATWKDRGKGSQVVSILGEEKDERRFVAMEGEGPYVNLMSKQE